MANEELPKDENPEEKIKEIIKVSFDSEEGLLDFLKQFKSMESDIIIRLLLML